jgi:hypothetical protein
VSGDEMEIVSPETKGKKFMVGSDNQVVDNHECVFAGDHSQGLDVNDKCTICGKSLGDFIEEAYDPTRPHIPIIIGP